MKKLLLSMCLFLSVMLTFGQNGLVDVFVEQIPVSAAAIAADPNLNANSVTYRIFVQMEPGHVISSVSGTFANPALFLTTTQFYNNADDGAVLPLFRPIPTMDEPLYYDSWITIGQYGRQAAASQLVPLAEDTDGVQDGIVLGAVTNATAVDPATDFEAIWGYEMTPSADYGTPGYDPENMIYYAAGGVSGITSSNTVCIGQLTTDGDVTFEFNFNIVPPTGPATMFVYRNPTIPGDIKIRTDECFFTTVNEAPVVSLTAPLSGATYIAGDAVAMAATASDADGSITRVEFIVDGVVVGQDLTAPYEFSWSSTTGNKSVTARAFDNGGKSTTSAAVMIIVNDPPANELPVATITAPAAGTEYDVITVPTATINIAATASDADGSVTSVEFFVNGVSIGTDATAPYEAVYTTTFTGNYAITAVATDNLGSVGAASAPVNVRVINSGVSYQLGNQPLESVLCQTSGIFCVPVNRIYSDITDGYGFDVIMKFDPSLVTPTGIVVVGNDLINSDITGYELRVDDDSIFVSVFINRGSALFQGQGNIFCVEFARNYPGFATGDTAEFSLSYLRESYRTTTQVANLPASYRYTTYSNPLFEGSMNFWADNSPIGGTAPTQIVSMSNSTYGVLTGLDGKFLYDVTNGLEFTIIKNNPGASSTFGSDPAGLTLEMWNSYDALLTQKVLVNDPSFLPSVFQMVAMDVNQDGVVSAGDVTQISQRAIMAINGFSNGRTWEWLTEADLLTNLRYRISQDWPFDDGVGYSKNRVPSVANQYTVNAGVDFPACAIMEGQNFKGVLLGDVDGSWRRVIADGVRKSASAATAMVLFDVNRATFEESYVDVPVKIFAEEAVNDLSFGLTFDTNKLAFHSIINHTEFDILDYNYVNDQLSLVSVKAENYAIEENVVSIRFYVKGRFNVNDIISARSFIGGEEVISNISSPTAIEDNFELMLKVYPNPAKDMLKVELPENAKIQLISVTGKVLYSNLNTNGVEEIDVQGFANGIYMLKVSNDRISTVRQIVIQK